LTILIATFCDAARAQGDRLDVLGAGIRVFFAPSVPTTVHTWLATLVATNGLEIGTDQYASLRIFDADMQETGVLRICVTTAKADRAGLGAQTAKVTPIKLRLETEGVYRAEVSVDDKVAFFWPFELVQDGREAAPFRRVDGY
jgi:hypothetical protein